MAYNDQQLLCFFADKMSFLHYDQWFLLALVVKDDCNQSVAQVISQRDLLSCWILLISQKAVILSHPNALRSPSYNDNCTVRNVLMGNK